MTQGHHDGISGTLFKQDGEQVSGFFRATEAASTAAQAGGPGKYRVRVRNKFGYGPYGVEKTWLIMGVIDGVSTEQKIETYEPRLKVQTPSKKLAPAPMPPLEQENVVPQRQPAIPMPDELSEPYVPQFKTEPTSPNNPESEPQGGYWDPADKGSELKPASERQGPVAANAKTKAKKFKAVR